MDDHRQGLVVGETVTNARMQLSGSGRPTRALDAWRALALALAMGASAGVVAQYGTGGDSKIDASPGPLVIEPRMTGTWFDPLAPGQGLAIEVLPGRQELFVAWFAYGRTAPSPGSQEHRWFTAQGRYDGARASLDAYLTTGGTMNGPSPVQTRRAGTLTIDFVTCSHAVATYALEPDALGGGGGDPAGLVGRMNLQRVSSEHACPVPATTRAALDQALARWSDGAGHYGVSASVVFPDRSIWNGVAGGSSPAQALAPNELIHVASITKSMTGALVLRLVDQGLLTLDDTIGRWLPTIPNVSPSITLRQLLTHSAGLANYPANRALQAEVVANPSRVFSASELAAYIDPPVFAPGTRVEYGNSAFLLLGLVAERVLGRPLDELYATELWQPLGLTGVFLPYADSPPGPVALSQSPYGLVDPLDFPSRHSRGQGAAGVMATAESIARWGDGLFRGRVVSPAMQVQLRTLLPAPGTIPGESGVGLGIRGYAYLGRTQFGHSGSSAFGNGLLLHDADTGVTVAVLMNQGDAADHFTLAPELLSIATGGAAAAATNPVDR